MSWHDNYVHALRIAQGEHGAGELILDVDYILEWIKGAEGMRFRILPVNLRFIEVRALRITLDYASPSAAMGTSPQGTSSVTYLCSSDGGVGVH